jgi:hypothetical protein
MQEVAQFHTLEVGDFVRYLGRHVERVESLVAGVSWTILKFTSVSKRPAGGVSPADSVLGARPCLS